MGRRPKKDEIHNRVGLRLKGRISSLDTIEDVIEAYWNIILEDLERIGEINLYKIGKFELKFIQGRDIMYNDLSSGTRKHKWVAPKKIVTFKPSKNFQEYIEDESEDKKLRIKLLKRKKVEKVSEKIYVDGRRVPNKSDNEIFADFLNKIKEKEEENDGTQE